MTAMPMDEIAEVLNRPLSRELLDRPLTRLAYVAKDGTPRVIPIAFVWNGAEVVVVTPTNAPKLASLRANPAVALTIDTEDHPPKILLMRGQAELDVVDGIPDEYLQANAVPPDQYDEWEREIRSPLHRRDGPHRRPPGRGRSSSTSRALCPPQWRTGRRAGGPPAQLTEGVEPAARRRDR